MKFGIRTPSLKKRISARTSVKRYVRHSMGLKAPRGVGLITNPKKAAYNHVYNRTSVSVDRLIKSSSTARSHTTDSRNSRKDLTYNLQNVGVSYRPQQVGGLSRLSALMFGNATSKARVKVSDAMHLLKHGDYSGAQILALEARRLDKTNIDADFILAICYNNLQQHEQALGAAINFLERVPDNQEILLVCATANFNLHNFEKALDVLAEMSEEAQQSLIVLKAKGMSFYNLKRYGEAVEVFKQAPLRIRNLTPALVEIHYWLARALEAQGKKKDAIKHYEKVSAIWFDFEDVQERLCSLGETKLPS